MDSNPQDPRDPYRPPASPPPPESYTGEVLNPWTSIWLRPRDTIQYIVDTNPRNSVLVLSAIAGVGQVLNNGSNKNIGDHMGLPMILMLALIIGPITGIIGLYLGGMLLRWSGRLLGGIGNAEHIRAALAWSSIPMIWAMLLWVPELVLFGHEMFTSEAPSLQAGEPQVFLLLGLLAIEMVISIWALVVFLKCLAQVQGFSAWKALANVLLIMLMLFGVVIVLGVGLMAVMPAQG